MVLLVPMEFYIEAYYPGWGIPLGRIICPEMLFLDKLRRGWYGSRHTVGPKGFVLSEALKQMIRVKAYHWSVPLFQRFHWVNSLRRVIRPRWMIWLRQIIRVEAYDLGWPNGLFFWTIGTEVNWTETNDLGQHALSRKCVKHLVFLIVMLYKWTMGIQVSTLVTPKQWLTYWGSRALKTFKLSFESERE